MTLLTTSGVAQQTIIEHDLLAGLIGGVRRTLDWQVEEDDFSRQLSTLRFMAKCFQRHFRRLIALEENDGYMDLVAETAPWLSRKVDALRSDHDQLREDAYRVANDLEQVSSTADRSAFASVCDDFLDLLQRVEEHSRHEVGLVQEAFDQDTGGEG